MNLWRSAAQLGALWPAVQTARIHQNICRLPSIKRHAAHSLTARSGQETNDSRSSSAMLVLGSILNFNITKRIMSMLEPICLTIQSSLHFRQINSAEFEIDIASVGSSGNI